MLQVLQLEWQLGSQRDLVCLQVQLEESLFGQELKQLMSCLPNLAEGLQLGVAGG